MSPTRHIFKSRWRSPDEARELLQSIFVAELLQPSRCIWIVSPWVSDLAIIDNRTGTFAGLDPRWTERQIRLTEVLERLLELGTHLVIATRAVAHNGQLIGHLNDAAVRLQLPREALTVHQTADLHEKGVLGDGFYLAGSMNLTYNGVEILEEALRYDTDPAVVGEVRISHAARWGGLLPRVDP